MLGGKCNNKRKNGKVRKITILSNNHSNKLNQDRDKALIWIKEHPKDLIKSNVDLAFVTQTCLYHSIDKSVYYQLTTILDQD